MAWQGGSGQAAPAWNANISSPGGASPMAPGSEGGQALYKGTRVRRHVEKKHFDPSSGIMKHIHDRQWCRSARDMPYIAPLPSAHKDLRLPGAYSTTMPAIAFCTKLGTANKCHRENKRESAPCLCIAWSPEGRRVVTGFETGEIALWMAPAYNFDTLFQISPMGKAITSCCFTHNEKWLVIGDGDGLIRYFIHYDEKINFKAHKEAVTDVSFSFTDDKYVTGSLDHTMRIWDFETAAKGNPERELRGHGNNITSAQWHPQTPLIASSSQDYTVRIWDARTDEVSSILRHHKTEVSSTRWANNGMWLLTAGQDSKASIIDIRTMKELYSFQASGPLKSVSWHPTNEQVFSSGSMDGILEHWVVGLTEPQAIVKSAHDNSRRPHINALGYHPAGHLLVTGGQDMFMKVWVRHRPGEGDALHQYFPPFAKPIWSHTLEDDFGAKGQLVDEYEYALDVEPRVPPQQSAAGVQLRPQPLDEEPEQAPPPPPASVPSGVDWDDGSSVPCVNPPIDQVAPGSIKIQDPASQALMNRVQAAASNIGSQRQVKQEGNRQQARPMYNLPQQFPPGGMPGNPMMAPPGVPPPGMMQPPPGALPGHNGPGMQGNWRPGGPPPPHQFRQQQHQFQPQMGSGNWQPPPAHGQAYGQHSHHGPPGGMMRPGPVPNSGMRPGQFHPGPPQQPHRPPHGRGGGQYNQ